MCSFSFAGPKTLEDIVKMELLDDKSVEEIEKIWKLYHQDKENVLGMTLPGTAGADIVARAKEWCVRLP
jgi:ATP11 protein